MSYYDILGVSKDADETEIRKAYRKLSLEWHPDRNASDSAKDRFQEINEAYETLSNANKRKEYDLQQQFGGGGGGGFPGFPFGGGGSDPFSDIFEMMFHGAANGGHGFPGGGGGIHIVHNGIPMHFGGGGMPHMFHFRQQAQKPAPIIKNIHISLAQAYTGCSISLEIERWVINNDIKHNEMEQFKLDIPAGVDSNENMVLRDKGNVQNGMHGDVKLCINVESHDAFQRNGLDLHYKKKISLKDALCGFNFDIKHLDGNDIALTNKQNKKIIRPGDKKVIPNFGMKKDDKVGSLIIEFEVEFPARLSDDQTRFLDQILSAD